ncbi:MAG: DUF1559 domain-containing protein [Armatimonadetes bacterium]|nr:DUF1559 domain-containing protein [Armatimonadota bacterium]
MHREGSNGFTLIELLVVIGIIMILVGLVIETMSHAREMARQTTCISNLRQIGQATMMYTQDWGDLPNGDNCITALYNSYTGQTQEIWMCPDDHPTPPVRPPQRFSYEYSWWWDWQRPKVTNAEAKRKLGFTNFPVFFCSWHTIGNGTSQHHMTYFLVLFTDGRVERFIAPYRKGWGALYSGIWQKYRQTIN